MQNPWNWGILQGVHANHASSEGVGLQVPQSSHPTQTHSHTDHTHTLCHTLSLSHIPTTDNTLRDTVSLQLKRTHTGIIHSQTHIKHIQTAPPTHTLTLTFTHQPPIHTRTPCPPNEEWETAGLGFGRHLGSISCNCQTGQGQPPGAPPNPTSSLHPEEETTFY